MNMEHSGTTAGLSGKICEMPFVDLALSRDQSFPGIRADTIAIKAIFSILDVDDFAGVLMDGNDH
jgi:hypothetical protein